MHVISSHSAFTLVPSDIDDNSAQQELFRINHRLEKDECLSSNLLKDGIILLHKLPTYLNENLSEKFPICTFAHSCEWLLKWVETNIKSVGATLCFQLDDDYLSLLSLNNGELQLLNQQYVKTNEDLFFEVMALVEQLELDIETMRLYSINLDSDAKTTNQFNNYVANIHSSTLQSINCSGHKLNVSLTTRLSCG